MIPPKVYNQIDMAATVSCLFGLSMPESNTGVAFINDVVEQLYATENEHAVASVFECVRRNYEQLQNVFDVGDEAEEFVKERERTSVLNRKFEEHVRRRIKSKYVDEKVNKEQDHLMIISILVLIIVINRYLKIQTEGSIINLVYFLKFYVSFVIRMTRGCSFALKNLGLAFQQFDLFKVSGK